MCTTVYSPVECPCNFRSKRHCRSEGADAREVGTVEVRRCEGSVRSKDWCDGAATCTAAEMILHRRVGEVKWSSTDSVREGYGA